VFTQFSALPNQGRSHAFENENEDDDEDECTHHATTTYGNRRNNGLSVPLLWRGLRVVISKERTADL